MNTITCREQTHWIGIDVAKATFDAALVLAHQHYPATPLHEIPVKTFDRNPKGVAELLAWLEAFDESSQARVVMEATGRYSTELALWLLDARPATSPAIVNPRHTAAFIQSMGLRNKTDRLEARALGFYGTERQPAPYEPPTPEAAELRELSRLRDYLVNEATRLKNKQHEQHDSRYVGAMIAKRLRLLKDDIARVERQMRELVQHHSKLKRDVDLLTTIYGIGFLNAAMLIAELGDIRRFHKARQLTAFAGMSPCHRQSGTSLRGKTSLSKQGNPRVRKGLYLSAMVAIRGNNQFRDTYQRLIAKGKPKMVAITVIMRKLLITLRAVLIAQQPFNPIPCTPIAQKNA